MDDRLALNVPSVLVVMGVSGSGKSTIAALLAGKLGWRFEDADDLHPPANVDKMQRGIPLTDTDRDPWLQAVAAWIDALRDAGAHGVLACSALRRRYRDVLIGSRADVRLAYLKGDRALIGRRQAARQGHFMPSSLMDSQFVTLEEPEPDESPIVVAVELTPTEIIATLIAALGLEIGIGGVSRTDRPTGSAALRDRPVRPRPAPAPAGPTQG